MTRRRYYLLKRLAARRMGYGAVEAVWRGKQESEPGTPLSSNIRSAALSSAGYTCREDLEGASLAELVDAGVPHFEATAALASLP